MKKSVVVLNHNGGQLANQLWNHLSIYAYGLERGYKCKNYCFFEYAEYFNIPVNNFLVSILFYKSFAFAKKILPFAVVKKIFRKIYKYYVYIIKKVYPKSIIYSRTTKDYLGTYFLPPSGESSPELKKAEDVAEDIFFDGWLFRNPEGMFKFRKEIINNLRPRYCVEKNTKEFINPLKDKFTKVIGVHIRQGDYKTFKKGRFYIDQYRVKEILEEYIKEFKVDRDDSCFVVCSNQEINIDIFSNLNIFRTNNNPIEDMFILSSCDVLLGNDSTYGHFASYYGDIPHIVFKNEPLDWNYYKENNNYFLNKYCLTVCIDPTLWNGF